MGPDVVNAAAEEGYAGAGEVVMAEGEDLADGLKEGRHAGDGIGESGHGEGQGAIDGTDTGGHVCLRDDAG